MKTVRLLSNGDIQVLVLPSEYRFDVQEVAIKRVGTAVVLVPRSKKRAPPPDMAPMDAARNRSAEE